ncbi:MAG: carbohydrate deacetylase, partial [Bryobacteraceae bacterium]
PGAESAAGLSASTVERLTCGTVAPIVKRLIVTADDFGLTGGVCTGILQGLSEGIVTSTSALVCDPAACRRLANWRDALAGQVGVHLQLTDGRPVCDPARIASLVTAEGAFPRLPGGIGAIDADDLRREWHAQVSASLQCGVEPTHVDTHHHVHSNATAFEVYCEIARCYDLAARSLSAEMTRELRARGLRCADHSAGWDGASQQSLLETISRLFACGENVAEVVCHPAHHDSDLEEASLYAGPRARELDVLCATGLRRTLYDRGIALASATILPV